MNLQHFSYSAVTELPHYYTVTLEKLIPQRSFKLSPNYSGVCGARSGTSIIPEVADDISSSKSLVRNSKFTCKN